MCEELKLQYTSLAVFNGSLGGSRQKLLTNYIKEKQSDIEIIIKDIDDASIINETAEIMTVEKINKLLIIYTMKHEELMSLNSELTIKKSELQSQLIIHQENAIKNT